MGNKTFIIEQGRVDFYYGLVCEKSVESLNRKISNSSLMTYKKIGHEMQINKKYVCEMRKREKIVADLIDQEMEEVSKNIEKNIKKSLEKCDDYIQKDVYVEKKDGTKIRIRSNEYNFLRKRANSYILKNEVSQKIYGQKYEDYKSVYLLKPILVSNKDHFGWGNIIMYVFIDGHIIIKFEIPFFDKNTNYLLKKAELMDYDFSIMKNSKKKMIFKSCGEIVRWYVDRLFRGDVKCLNRIENIIISNYKPMVKNINDIDDEMKEKIYRIIAAPVPTGKNFDYKKNIKLYWNDLEYSYSGMQIFCNRMGGALILPDKRYIKKYKNNRKEITIIEQIDVNVEFAIIIILLKNIISKEVVNKIRFTRNSERKYIKYQYKSYKSDLMICALEEDCYGSVHDQIKYLEKNMDKFIRQENVLRRKEAMHQIVIAKGERRREHTQQIINVTALAITFIGGVPGIKQTLKIINRVMPKYIQTFLNNSYDMIALIIWGVLAVIMCFVYLKKD